ncbi:MAG: DNA polymerase III subunit delta [Bacteroidales bacterium]
MAKQKLSDTVDTFERIRLSIQQKIYKPIYLLYGSDSYYINELSDFVAREILPETERAFNQVVLYGKDVTVQGIIETARRYPMMGNYQVVVVKEAQDVKKLDLLVHYLNAPLASTILVICHKGALGAKLSKVATMAKKVGEVMETSEARDYEIPAWINQIVKQKNKKINLAAVNMLCDFLGSDLAKIEQEIDKLLLLLPVGTDTITAAQVEACTGISKDYNPYELTNAVLAKDVLKANQIILYFEKNPKVIAITGIVSTLFLTFSKLFSAQMLLSSKGAPLTDIELREHLGIVSFIYKQTYLPAMRRYSATQCAKIISLLRELDLRAKGLNRASASDGDLLREYIYKIMH